VLVLWSYPIPRDVGGGDAFLAFLLLLPHPARDLPACGSEHVSVSLIMVRVEGVERGQQDEGWGKREGSTGLVCKEARHGSLAQALAWLRKALHSFRATLTTYRRQSIPVCYRLLCKLQRVA
jgi:hypothetical protein